MVAADLILSRAIVGARDVQPSHLILQGGPLKTQAFCRPAISRDLPGGVFQGIDDRLPLRLFKCRG